MLVACWSSKGGAGTTVVAAALALLLGRAAPDGALLVDLAGDVPAGPRAARSGRSRASPGWLAAGADVPADALGRLEVAAGDGLALLPRGRRRRSPPDRAEVLARAARPPTPRPVVVDCGTDPSGVALAVAAGATRSILVTRACFLSLRRAMRAAAATLGGRAPRRAGPRPHAAPTSRTASARRSSPRSRSTRRWPAPSTPACWPPACRAALARELGRAA